MTGEGRSEPTRGLFAPSASLATAGLAFLGLGLVLGVAYVAGEVRSSLFPAGWIFPAVLIVTGGLMLVGRRFDIAMTLWAGLSLGVFLLDGLVYMNGLDRGLDDPAAFDAAIVVAAFGLVVLILRPRFRS
jgi:hypothetical protein